MALLGFDRERRDRTRLEPLEGDRLAGFLAVAVGTLVQTGQRLIDLGYELALPVAGAQLDRAIRFRGSPVGQVRVVLVLGLEVSQRLLGFLENVLFPGQQFLPEILPLPLVHERLANGRSVLLLLGLGLTDGSILVTRDQVPDFCSWAVSRRSSVFLEI